MLIADYIFEQEYQGYSDPQQIQQEPQDSSEQLQENSEIEPIKKLIVIDMFYRLFISLSSSVHPERDKLVNAIDNILKFSSSMSYQTLISLLDSIVRYLNPQQQTGDSYAQY
jgi:hypothetical protein